MTRIPLALVAIWATSLFAAEPPQKMREANQPSSYDEAFDFRGVRLGMTLSQFKTIPAPIEPSLISQTAIAACEGPDESARKYGESTTTRVGIWMCRWVWPGYDFSADVRIAGYSTWTDRDAGRYSRYWLEFISKPGDTEPRLFRMTFKVRSDAYEAIAAALEQRFGKPASVESHSVQNSMGAIFPNETRVWSRNSSNVGIRRFEDDLNTTMLRYWLADYLEHYERRWKDEEAKGPPKL